MKTAPPFLTSALDGGECSASDPRRFIPGERARRYPLDGTLGGSHSPSGQCGEEKILFPLPGIEPRQSSP
jgi:hypothetical protein